jgi:hypothetical protein
MYITISSREIKAYQKIEVSNENYQCLAMDTKREL